MSSTNRYLQKFSILRIVTNSTPSVVAIIIFLILLTQFFGWRIYTNYWYVISEGIIELTILAYVIIHAYKENKNSVFYIDAKVVYFHKFDYPNKIDTIEIKNIEELTIKSCNLIIKDNKGQKLIIDYLNNPKNLKQEIEKRM